MSAAQFCCINLSIATTGFLILRHETTPLLIGAIIWLVATIIELTRETISENRAP